MALLKGPLFSLGAKQQLGKALVYFGWKGLDVVREYVIPANPKTALQTTQRGYLTAAVAYIHAVQAAAANPLGTTDVSAYALWASVVQAATTWFNQAVRNFIDQNIAGLTGSIWRGGTVTEAANQLTLKVWNDQISAGKMTAVTCFYGTSRTALINPFVCAIDLVGHHSIAVLPALTSSVKYFMQFRPTAGASHVGANSGIYYGYPT